LVSNVGIDFLGAIEEQDEADYRKIFEVNFFGAVALLRLAPPLRSPIGTGSLHGVQSRNFVS
jgi:NAD(P)-dependent dehydrogenase (short-subunit alcohol dehydrogenase family)